jgi:heme-degrading monooxygenase HmoA
MKSERKANRMHDLYKAEASKRGDNLYALYSAFTNYSTYADERNGFKERNTGKDTKAVTMWKREEEVSKWVSSPQFKALTNA